MIITTNKVYYLPIHFNVKIGYNYTINFVFNNERKRIVTSVLSNDASNKDKGIVN
jgi:hypothetical protein